MKRCVLVLNLLIGLLVLCRAAPVRAAGLIVVEDSSWRPGPIPPRPIPPPWPRPLPRPYCFAPLEVSYVKVTAQIHDQLALTTVEQEFFNPNSSRLEGSFIFPVPKGAQLDKFSMQIDGRQVQAELLPAQKARHLYEDIVRQLRDPALLEYAERDLFKVRIFPIEAHSHKRIVLSYSQVLRADDGLLSYVLPLNTEKFSAAPIRSVSVKIDLESSQPLKAIYSPTHALELKRTGPYRASAGFEASQVQPDTDLVLYYAPQKQPLGLQLLSHKPAGEQEGYFLLLACPGLEATEKQVLLKDVVFVLDTSGSMAGKKLEQAKKALQFCIENLSSGDRFELVRFSTEAEPLFDQLVEAAPANLAKAQAFLAGLKPIGGTAIDEALQKAFSLLKSSSAASPEQTRPRVVIFLTDGQPTVGTTEEAELLEHVKGANASQARLFCFGIGTDVNTHLLDGLSQQSRGFSQYVLAEEDLELKLSSFFSKIKAPVLADPSLTFSGDIHVSKLSPAALPDLFKGEQLVLVGRYSGQGSCSALLEGSLNGKRQTFRFPLNFAALEAEHDFIGRLWATRRVGHLLDEIRLHGENSELREEVSQLARRYNILTPYTAFLILEDERRRQVPEPLRSLQEFDQDEAARHEAQQAWSGFKQERAGEAAVAGARQSLAFKGADAPSSAAASGLLEGRRALGLNADSAGAQSPTAQQRSKARLMDYSQQGRFVGGKSFYPASNQWVDGEVQQHPGARRVELKLGSAGYFDFLASHPQALAWAALGGRVQFVLQGVIYQIQE